MRVLWITERFPPDRGGAAVSAGRQCAAAAPELERLDVLRLTSDLPAGRAEIQTLPDERGNLRIHRVGRAREDDQSLQILAATAANLVQAHRHDVVHGFCAVHAGYVAVQTAREAGLPSVVSLRGNDLDRARFHGPRLPFLLWTLERADALAVLSDEMVRRVRSLAGRTEGVRILRNAVDPDEFTPDGDAAAFDDVPRPWIGFVGELRLKKGLPLLEDLAQRMADEDRGTLFWIGGRREPGAAAPARVREIPYARDPAALAATLRAMDLVVFPSLWDGMPNALLEAMACGRPVLASAVGAIPDVVQDGMNGFLVAPGRLDGFAEEALRVAALPAEQLVAVGAAARERAVNDYSPAAEREALLALWRDVLR